MVSFWKNTHTWVNVPEHCFPSCFLCAWSNTMYLPDQHLWGWAVHVASWRYFQWHSLRCNLQGVGLLHRRRTPRGQQKRRKYPKIYGDEKNCGYFTTFFIVGRAGILRDGYLLTRLLTSANPGWDPLVSSGSITGRCSGALWSVHPRSKPFGACTALYPFNVFLAHTILHIPAHTWHCHKL